MLQNIILPQVIPQRHEFHGLRCSSVFTRKNIRSILDSITCILYLQTAARELRKIFLTIFGLRR